MRKKLLYSLLVLAILTTAIPFQLVPIGVANATTGQSQLIIGGYITSPPTGATPTYNGLAGGYIWRYAAFDSQQLVSTPGTITTLEVRLSGSPGSGKSYTFTLMKNMVAQALEVVIADENTQGIDLAAIAVVAGDALVLRCTPSGTPTSRSVTWSSIFEGDNPNESLILGGGFIYGNRPSFTPLQQCVSDANPAELGAYEVIPTAGKIKNLYVALIADPGDSGDGYKFTLRKNGGNTTLTCTITDPNTTGSDTTHEVSVAAGDLVTLMSEGINTPISNDFNSGLTFVADTTGEFIFLGYTDTSPTLDVVRYNYTSPGTMSTPWDATESNRYQGSLSGFTLKNLYTWISGTSSGDYLLKVRKTGADSGIAATVSAGVQVGYDIVHTYNTVDYEYLDMSVLASGTEQTVHWGLVGCEVVVTPPLLGTPQMIIGGYYDILNTSTTEYTSFSGGYSWYSTQTDYNQVVSTSGVIEDLRVELSNVPGSGKDYTFTLMKNGVATDLSVKVENPYTYKSDTTNSVSVAAGDYISLRCTPTGTPDSAWAQWSSTFTAYTANESLLLAMGGGSNAATRYVPLQHGYDGGTGNETDAYQVMPTSGNISALRVKLDADPGTSPDAYKITLRKNGGNTTLTCTITADSTTGSDIVNSVAVVAGDLVNWMIEPLNSPANASPIVSIGATFTSTIEGESLLLGQSSDLPTLDSTEYNSLSSTIYNRLWVAEGAVTQRPQLSSSGFTLRSFYAWISGTSTGNYTVKVALASSPSWDTTLSILIGNGTQTGNDISHELYCSSYWLVISTLASGTAHTVHWGIVSYYPPAGATPPTVTTQVATFITSSTATGNGNITNVGDEPPSQRGFDWDINTGTPYSNSVVTSGTYGVGTFVGDKLVSLPAGTLIYYRAKAYNSAGWGYGSESIFLTKPKTPVSFSASPEDTQNSLSWIKGTGAANTIVRGKEGSYPTSYNTDTAVYSGTGTGTIHASLDNGDTWYYRAWSQTILGGYTQYSDNYAQAYATPASNLPAVSTYAAIDITQTGANLKGDLTILGNVTPVYVYFQYGLTGSYGTSTAEQTRISTGEFSQSISGLSSYTLYYFRAVVRYGVSSYIYGNGTYFITSSVGAPTVVTIGTTSVTSRSAYLRGDLTSLGDFSMVYVYYQYGLTNSYGIDTYETTKTFVGTIYQSIIGLTPDTTYHFRIAVRYGEGTYAYGLDSTFKTLAPAIPTAVTNNVVNLGSTSCTLQGIITSLGDYTTVNASFEYGLTSSYGIPTMDQTFIAASGYNYTITGLTPNTLYHYRARVWYSSGLFAYSSDATFTTTTLGIPTVVTSIATDITTTTATLQGTLTNLGEATTVIVFFQYGATTGYGNNTGTQTVYTTGSYHQAITGLPPGTTCHFRIVAWNPLDIWNFYFGLDGNFTTTIGIPSISTLAASVITDDTSTLNGFLDDLGIYSTGHVNFDYGYTAAYELGSTPEQAKATTGGFNQGLTNLIAGTTYHFRAKARFGTSGYVYGSDGNFTTTGVAPTPSPTPTPAPPPGTCAYLVTSPTGDISRLEPIQNDGWPVDIIGNMGFAIYGKVMAAQTFTTMITHNVSSIRIFGYIVGDPIYITLDVMEVTTSTYPSKSFVANNVWYSGVNERSEKQLISSNFTTDSSGSWIEFVFDKPFKLIGNTTYAIVVSSQKGTMNDNYQWKWDTATPATYDLGSAWINTNGGADKSWVQQTNHTFMFEVYGSAGLMFEPNAGVRIYQSFYQTGDWLIVIAYKNTTPPYYDTGDVQNYFTAQLINPATCIGIAKTVPRNWDAAPISIYISQEQALTLSWGANYIVRIQATYDGNFYVDQQLTSENWVGDTLANLDSWIMSEARWMGIENENNKNYYIQKTGSNIILNADGTTLFEMGIPSLGVIRGNTTEIAYVNQYNEPARTPNSVLQGHYNPNVQLGPELVGALGQVGAPFSLTSREIGLLVVLALYVFVVGSAFPIGHGLAGSIAGMVIIMIGATAGVVDWVWIALAVIFAGAMMLRQALLVGQ